MNFSSWIIHQSILILEPVETHLFYFIYKKNVFVLADVKPVVSTVLRHGQAFSPIYRFSLSDGTIVSAHTKSKLVRSSATNEPQLYMSLHLLQRYVPITTHLSERKLILKFA